MELRAIKIDKKFTPEFNGNKNLPIDQQLVIIFNRIPGTSEKTNYKNIKGNATGDVQLIYNDQVLVSTFVERIENLTLDFGNEKRFIKTGSDLAQANSELLMDLFHEIRNHLFPDNEEFSEGE